MKVIPCITKHMQTRRLETHHNGCQKSNLAIKSCVWWANALAVALKLKQKHKTHKSVFEVKAYLQRTNVKVV